MRKQIIAQMPPMGDPMGGMPPMGGAPPGAPPGGAPVSPKPAIAGPLDSIGEVLYDFNAEEYIALHPDKEEEEIAQEIWEAYGGNPDGTSANDKLGERDEKDAQNPPEVATKNQEQTENTKWKRLPNGKSIADIASLEEIIGLMKSLAFGTVKKFRTPPAPAGGGMPPMAASNNRMERNAIVDSLRKDLDKLKKYMK